MVAGYGPARHNLRRLFDKSADDVITWCDVICIKQIDEHHAVISFRMGVNDKPVIVYGRLLKALIEGANGGKITREVIERAIF